jgi:hypothetical protein
MFFERSLLMFLIAASSTTLSALRSAVCAIEVAIIVSPLLIVVGGSCRKALLRRFPAVAVRKECRDTRLHNPLHTIQNFTIRQGAVQWTKNVDWENKRLYDCL